RRDLAEIGMTVERVGTAIIGGGIAGCALAYYLAAEGETDILLVEADEMGSGSTGGSFGGVRQQFSTPLEIGRARRRPVVGRRAGQGGKGSRRALSGEMGGEIARARRLGLAPQWLWGHRGRARGGVHRLLEQ